MLGVCASLSAATIPVSHLPDPPAPDERVVVSWGAGRLGAPGVAVEATDRSLITTFDAPEGWDAKSPAFWRMELDDAARAGGLRVRVGDQPAQTAFRANDGSAFVLIPSHQLSATGNRVVFESPDGGAVEPGSLRLIEMPDPVTATHAQRMIRRWEEFRHQSLFAEGTDSSAKDAALNAARAVPLTYDVDHYRIELEPQVTGIQMSTMDGTVTISARAVSAGLSSIAIDFNPVMQVLEVRDAVTNQALSFTHPSNGLVLNVSLGRTLAAGEAFSVRIKYRGFPESNSLGFGTSFQADNYETSVWIWTLSEPYGARDWWPCQDRPDDKSTATIVLALPPGLEGLSNGTLDSVAPRGDGKVLHTWNCRYPISTYLVSIIISDMEVLSTSYTPPGTSSPIPVEYWALPGTEADILFDWGRTPQMLGAFGGRFGEYPFANEKYAMGLFNWGGGMEHQTASSMGTALLTGDRRYESIVAHELGHQWWGDFVTIAEFSHIWLNEGFASYTEAVWFESVGGAASLREYMLNYRGSSYTNTTVLNPSANNLFSGTVYRKGMWTLHMLRKVMGDTNFFRAMKTYGQRQGYANAYTQDFEDACESIHGEQLDWFFDQWLTKTGKPSLGVGVASYRTEQGDLYLTGITSFTSGYRMPVDLLVTLSNGSSVKTTVWAQSGARFANNIGFFPTATVTGVTVDPDVWLLYTGSAAPTVPLMAHVASTASAKRGEPFRLPLYASGGAGGYQWSLDATSAPLPAGIALSNGVLTGTPTAAGTYNLVLRLQDTTTFPSTVLVPITLQVSGAASGVLIR